jgi:hypothetical protein
LKMTEKGSSHSESFNFVPELRKSQ